MSEKEKTPAAEDLGATQAPGAPQLVENLPSRHGQVSALASANAPFIYFDGVPFVGQHAGVGQITLTTARYIAYGPNSTAVPDHVVTAMLRAPLPVLIALRHGIDEIEKKILKEEAAKAAPAAIVVPPGKAH